MTRASYYRQICGVVCARFRPDMVVLAAGSDPQLAEPGILEVADQRHLPGSCVLLLDVLQKLPDEEIRQRLAAIAANDVDFLAVIPLTYSDKLRADGTNEHTTVKPKEWWLTELRRLFPDCAEVRAFNDSDLTVSRFEQPPETRAEIARLVRIQKRSRLADRLKAQLAIWRRLLRGDIDSESELFEELNGKSVSVVGNARSLGQTDLGRRIDANDLVIRFNLAPIISRASHGYRTDWLATSVPLEPALLQATGARRVLWMSRYRRKITAPMLKAGRFYLNSLGNVKRLVRRAGVERPSTGLMVIDLLARSPCRSVELYGFDFYKSQSFSSHQTVETAPHAFDREEAFVVDLAARDQRFKIWR